MSQCVFPEWDLSGSLPLKACMILSFLLAFRFITSLYYCALQHLLYTLCLLIWMRRFDLVWNCPDGNVVTVFQAEQTVADCRMDFVLAKFIGEKLMGVWICKFEGSAQTSHLLHSSFNLAVSHKCISHLTLSGKERFWHLPQSKFEMSMQKTHEPL